MRKIIHSIEEIILKEYPDGGFTSIEVEKLTMKMKELHTEETLVELSNETGLPLAAVKNMTLIAMIKSDIANKNIMGWKQHEDVLKEDGFLKTQ